MPVRKDELEPMDEISYKPIGMIRSTVYGRGGNADSANGAAGGKKALWNSDPIFAPGLKDLAGFSHIILIYHFHLSKGYSLDVKPFLDDTLRGVFATRAPRRPNPIGLSVVQAHGHLGDHT